MFTGPVGPVEVFFYWPEAVSGNFYWPGAIGSPLASSPAQKTIWRITLRHEWVKENPQVPATWGDFIARRPFLDHWASRHKPFAWDRLTKRGISVTSFYCPCWRTLECFLRVQGIKRGRISTPHYLLSCPKHQQAMNLAVCNITTSPFLSCKWIWKKNGNHATRTRP